MYQDMCMYLITPGVCTLLLNAPPPTQWPPVLLILCIMHSVYCIWAIQPVHCDSPFTYTRCIYICPKRKGRRGLCRYDKEKGAQRLFWNNLYIQCLCFRYVILYLFYAKDSWFLYSTQLVQQYFYSLKSNSFREAEFQKIWRTMALLVKPI